MDKGKLYRILEMAILIAMLLIGGLVYTKAKNNEDGTDAPTGQTVLADFACGREKNAELLFSALPLLQAGYTDLSEEVAGKIESLDGYADDPNCMFVLTRLYINSFQLSRAQESFEQYRKVFISEESIKDRFGPYAIGKDIITIQLESLVTQDEAVFLNIGELD